MKKRLPVIFALGLFFVSILLAKFALAKASFPLGKHGLIAPLPNRDPVKELEEILQEKGIAIEQGPVASDSALVVVLANNETVLFHANKDMRTQVGSLQIILNKLTIEERKAKKIDLRFEDPIVLY